MHGYGKNIKQCNIWYDNHYCFDKICTSMTFFTSIIEIWESTRSTNGCETCLNTDLKLEHYSVKHSSRITSCLLARVWVVLDWVANLNVGLNCHTNQSACATAMKNNTFVEANAMNISKKFQLYSFWGVDYLFIFSKFSLLVAMTTNQIARFGQTVYVL